jgi:hypothetical protein
VNLRDEWENWPPPPRTPYLREETAEPTEWQPEAHDPKALRALLNFCVNNKELDKLNSIIGAFNPFKILGVQDFEIRHSNVLAWLIDPKGHHGLGDAIFKSILLEVLKDNRGGGLPKIEDVIGAGFSDIKVQREWRNIDICCVSPANNLVLVIENKVGAAEDKQQLQKYVDIVEKKYPHAQKVFVFLSIDGAAPQGSNRYVVFTHGQIHGIVSAAAETHKEYMNAKVYDFICQYLKVLEEKSMKSEELTAICTKLYRDNADAIRTIIKYGKPKLQPEYMRQFHEKTATESARADKESVNVYYSFIPREWSNIVPATNKYTSDRYLVFFQFNFSDYEAHKVTLSLNIGNFPDQEERARFVGMVDEAVRGRKDCKLSVRKSSTTNMIVFSKAIPLEYGANEKLDLDDNEAVTTKLVEAYNSPDTQQALEIVGGVVLKFEFMDAAALSEV